eukprot:CAMPEP_0178717664 /NCGR_PEP_ID=MMETSP0699-20121125/22064_1 /TAXON_ID=265572 /ORGANISM="Extubocellulus spinifer, Strain CCMP396" /LENGTH=311 /DNA_ID=CAMNT_0020367553 /DNA_START=97 /DNA_END=1032 /DNA_ORIENTATION=+
MSLTNPVFGKRQSSAPTGVMATSGAAAAPGLLQQVGMAGGAAVITVTFIHPVDVVKTRIQISSEYGALGMVGSTKKIIGGEGVTALWKGVNAAWLREASYTSLRLGLYEPCKVAFGCTTPETTTFVKKFAAGSAAGALGSLAGNPFDVLKTKMMASEAAGTPSIVGTAKELLSKQGLAGFYRGIDSNIMRAMVLNGTKMACYDQAKGVVMSVTGLDRTHILTSFLSAASAGFFMTCTVSPFDMIRTRLMNQPADAKIYNNAADCFVKICRQEGPLTLWRGFMPIWSRFAPTTTLQLIIFEQLRSAMGMKAL